MTHSYEDIIRLDSERTPGIWEAGVHPGNHRLNIVKPICFGKYVGKLPECEGGAVYFLHTANAQYIAAMPDAVGLLKEFKADNTKLKQLLDRAIMGLEEVSHKADEVYGIGKDNTRFCGDIAKNTLADIRSKLGDTNG